MTSRVSLIALALAFLAVPDSAQAQLGAARQWPFLVPGDTPKESKEAVQMTADSYNDACDPAKFIPKEEPPQICKTDPWPSDDPETFQESCPTQPKIKGWTRICVPTVLGGTYSDENIIISPPFGILVATVGSVTSLGTPTLKATKDVLGTSGGKIEITAGAIVGWNLEIVAETQLEVGLAAIALIGDLSIDTKKLVIGEATDPLTGDLVKYDVAFPGLGLVTAGGTLGLTAKDLVDVRAYSKLSASTLLAQVPGTFQVAPNGYVSVDRGGTSVSTPTQPELCGFGGSYGGLGGAWKEYCPSCAGESPIPARDLAASAAQDPTRPVVGAGGGSCPGCYEQAGGPGGGLFRGAIGTLDLQGDASGKGILSANGGIGLHSVTAAEADGGGGSGGGIDLEVATLKGSGVIRANGAASSLIENPGWGGGGGGGRIAIRYDDRGGWSGEVTAYGAMQGPRDSIDPVFSTPRGKSGGAGTIFWLQKSAPPESGELVIANPPPDPATWPVGLDTYQMTEQGWGSTPIGTSFSTASRNITVSGAVHAVVVGDQLAFKTLSVTRGATLALAGCDQVWGCDGTHALELKGDSVTVDAASRISVTGRGGPGAPDLANPAVAVTEPDGKAPALSDASGMVVPGAFAYAGGSFGGEGGRDIIFPDGRPNGVFGSPTEVRDFGRGGGGQPFGTSFGLPGGGLLAVSTRLLSVDGVIAADGATSPWGGTVGAGGSGGGIRIQTAQLQGRGAITASGGLSCPTASWLLGTCGDTPPAGGGGGRIAIEYDDRSQWMGTITAHGARFPGGRPVDAPGRALVSSGATGTVFWRARSQPDTAGELVVEGPSADEWMWPPGADPYLIGRAGWATTPLDASFFSGDRSLVVRGDATYAACRTSDVSVRELRVEGGATFGLSRCESPWGCDDELHALRIVAAGDVVVTRGSRIDVSGRGGAGAAVSLGRLAAPSLAAADGAIVRGSGERSGGSYGGFGWHDPADPLAVPNPTFGEADDPVDFGRGGGPTHTDFDCFGYPGGGFLSIRASRLDLAGALAAVGAPGSQREPADLATSQATMAGGGSGGGISLDVGTLVGDGSIVASGAHVVDRVDCLNFFPGGGGRVLVRSSDRSSWTGTVDVSGGTCAPGEAIWAGDGTVRWASAPVAQTDAPAAPVGQTGAPASSGGGCSTLRGRAPEPTSLLPIAALIGLRIAGRRRRA
jgi:hypothetical protein